MNQRSIQSNLCKGLRACGIPKKQTHEIVNIVNKWLRESGTEWTNSRIKDLRQWYETTLTGVPTPPEWFRHTKEGYPTGIWNWVFKLPIAKALGVLSLNTVFYEDKLSVKQLEKFEHALAGNGTQNAEILKQCNAKFSESWMKRNLPKKIGKIQFPTVFDMTGSIPVHDGQSTVHPEEKLGEALKALRLSWESVPQATFDFLDRSGLLGYMPMDVVGNAYQLELNRPHSRIVGRVSVLQQPQLKARTVGNPNRVMQVTLEPLKALYMGVARKLPSDVTHDQESGVLWVQSKLKQGIELAGSDLTSASDLLDVELSLDLVDKVFGFPKVLGYQEFRKYFLEVSRGTWYCKELNREVKWQQGNVLGTGPSFGLLTLTNNAAALCAWKQAKDDGALSKETPWHDCYRIVGDDIVMRSQLEPYYTRIIEGLGGEINHSKTLKSNRVAEFAGRIITSDCSYLKAVKYSEPSDNSFMSYVAQLGDQAKYFLMPKQRRSYEFFKYVPGLLVEGPWIKDSYGVPLGPRYSWYLTEVQPALEATEPDLKLEDYSMTLLKAQLSLAEASEPEDGKSYDEPLLDDGYLPSQVTPTFKVGGDPRLVNGQTQLDVLDKHIVAKDIPSFEDWMHSRVRLAEPPKGEEAVEPQTPISSVEELRSRLESLKQQAKLLPVASKPWLENYKEQADLTNAIRRMETKKSIKIRSTERDR